MKFSIEQARLVTTVLVLINVSVGTVLIYRAWQGTQTASLLATVPHPFGAPKLDIVPPTQPASLASIQDQALFYSDRQFYTPPPPSAVPAGPPKPDYRLVGTFIIPSKPTIALLSNSPGVSRKVKTGDDLDGWLVAAVERGRVILEFGSTTFDITSAAKVADTGMQAVPLTRQAQATAPTGIRTLGSTAQASPLLRSGYTAPSSSPRLYRPPPK